MREWYRLSSAPGTGIDKTIFGIGQLSSSHPQFQTSSCWAGNMPRYKIFSPLSIFRSYNNGFVHVEAFSRPAMPGNRVLWDLAESFANSGRPRPDPEGFFFLPEFRPFSNFPVFVIEKKLCSLRKESMCLPVHLQMSACKAIDSALRFKGFEPPRLSAPLTIPFLSGSKLRSVKRQVLRLVLSQNLGLFLPFYVPKTTLVFAQGF